MLKKQIHFLTHNEPKSNVAANFPNNNFALQNIFMTSTKKFGVLLTRSVQIKNARKQTSPKSGHSEQLYPPQCLWGVPWKTLQVASK